MTEPEHRPDDFFFFFINSTKTSIYDLEENHFWLITFFPTL